MLACTTQSLLGVLDRVANTTEYAVNACMQALGQYGEPPWLC